MRRHATRGIAWAGLVGACWAVGAQAADITVTETGDAGPGTLRQAILDANAGDRILFDLDPDSTITLTDPLPGISENVSIEAGAVTGLRIQGNGTTLVTIDADTRVADIGLLSGDVTLEMDRTLTAVTSRSTTFESDLTGAGSLTKQGTATLTLSGTNDYTGGTTIEDGTLVGDTDSLPGDIEVETPGTLTFSQAAAGTFAGVISGAGRVEKRDLGEVTLSGTNTWTGGTAINGGALVATAPTSIPGDVDLGPSGKLVLDFSADDAFDGNVSGEGGLEKRGATEVTLTGSHSYSGVTTIVDGALIGPATAFPSDVAVAGGAEIILDQASGSTGTLGGDISGDGALVKRGAGTARLTGVNIYAGGTTVEAGTLSVTAASLPGDATIAMDATLAFDQAGAGTYGGVLDGAGVLEKLGAGRLTLSGAHTFTGGTTVTAGALDLTGSLASGVVVGSGGRLEGTGTVNDAVSVRGVIAPGSGADGIGMLSMGSLGFDPGGALEVQIDPADPTDDRLAVVGTADVASGTLRLDPLPGDYTLPVTRQVLTAGTLNGAFPDPEPFLLLDVTVDQVGNQVSVTLERNAANLAEVGTENQAAVGGALASLEGTPGFEEVFENLNIVTAAEGGDTLDSLGGEPIAAFTTARVALGEHFQRLVHRRLRGALFTRPPSPLLGMPRNGDPPPWRPGARGLTDVAAAPDGSVGLWFDANGLFGEVEGDGNSADADYLVGGGTLGLDTRLGRHGRAGLAVGYANTGAELDEPEGQVDAHTAQAALYAGYATPRLHLGASGRYAWSRADSERDIRVGDLAYTADGDFDSHDYGARAELALEAFPNGRFSLQPLGAFEWGHYRRESFTESGADVLSLDVDEEEIDTATLQLGARLVALFAMEDGLYLAPELRAYWIREFGDLDRRVEASLGGAPFAVSGAEGRAERSAGGGGLGRRRRAERARLARVRRPHRRGAPRAPGERVDPRRRSDERVQPVRRPREVPRWDAEADVIVVGQGIAGRCAALEACHAGADVLVLERAGAGGGTSANSGGLIYLGGGTPVQRATGHDDDPEQMFRFLMAASEPGPCEEKIRVFCEQSVEHFHWLEGQGCPSSAASIRSRAWNRRPTTAWSSPAARTATLGTASRGRHRADTSPRRRARPGRS
jgi:autotransporter-associated beta strand protein